MLHKLTTTSLASDAAVTFIAPEDTQIEAIRWVVDGTTASDGGRVTAELSFAATNQVTINDVVNVIDMATTGVELTTSGATAIGINDYHPIPGGVSVEAGEKVYLHTSGSGISGRVTVFLYTSARRNNKSSFRRR